MNNVELESRLRSVPVPERPAEYWDDFPSSVRVQLRHRRTTQVPRKMWRPRLIWSFDFAIAAVMVLVCLQYHPLQAVSASFARHEKYFNGQLARLDAGLHKLVLNTDGMGYLLSDTD